MSFISYQDFISHSGIRLPWKIDCDSLSNEDMEGFAWVIRHKFAFSRVIGIPEGGN